MQHKTFASLGLIKALADDGRDYVDLFLPFVKVVVSTLSTLEPIIDVAVKQGLLNDFGLEIPQHTVNFLLRKLYRQGYFRNSHGQYYVTKPMDVKPNFMERRDQIEIAQGELITELKVYAADRYKRNWNEDETYDALLAYISMYGIDSIRAYVQRNSLPTPAGTPDYAWYVECISA